MNKRNIASIRDQLNYMLDNHMLQGPGVDGIKNLIVELNGEINMPEPEAVTAVSSTPCGAAAISEKLDAILSRVNSTAFTVAGTFDLLTSLSAPQAAAPAAPPAQPAQ